MRNGYRSFLNIYTNIFGIKEAKKFDARYRFNRTLDLDNPKTLADKVSWLELNINKELAAYCTDKISVRDYLKEKGYSDILVPQCGGPWSNADEINFDTLPDSFVLKAAHGSGMNYICKDKSVINKTKIRSIVSNWLKSDYARSCIEPHYKLIPHRVYAEKYLGNFDSIIDYKIHCLNGKPCFILTCSNRESSLKLNLYDIKWNSIDGIQGHKKNDTEIEKPSELSKMLEISRNLAKDFIFVRIDLYQIKNKVYFGEMTFSPASGVFPNFTDEFVEYWGPKLKIEENK